MARPIDADALMETIRAREYPLTDDPLSTYYGLSTDGIQQAVDEQPTISADDAQGVGKWIKRFDGPYGRGRTYCSSCGKHSGIGGIKQTPPYCPNCGAKMEVSEDDVLGSVQTM